MHAMLLSRYPIVKRRHLQRTFQSVIKYPFVWPNHKEKAAQRFPNRFKQLRRWRKRLMQSFHIFAWRAAWATLCSLSLLSLEDQRFDLGCYISSHNSIGNSTHDVFAAFMVRDAILPPGSTENDTLSIAPSTLSPAQMHLFQERTGKQTKAPEAPRHAIGNVLC